MLIEGIICSIIFFVSSFRKGVELWLYAEELTFTGLLGESCYFQRFLQNVRNKCQFHVHCIEYDQICRIYLSKVFGFGENAPVE